MGTGTAWVGVRVGPPVPGCLPVQIPTRIRVHGGPGHLQVYGILGIHGHKRTGDGVMDATGNGVYSMELSGVT